MEYENENEIINVFDKKNVMNRVITTAHAQQTIHYITFIFRKTKRKTKCSTVLYDCVSYKLKKNKQCFQTLRVRI